MMVKMMMIASFGVVQTDLLEHGVQRVEQRFLRHHVGEHDAEHDPGVALDLAGMPSAKELSTDSTTAATATTREMMKLFQNFSGKLVVVQKGDDAPPW